MLRAATRPCSRAASQCSTLSRRPSTGWWLRDVAGGEDVRVAGPQPLVDQDAAVHGEPGGPGEPVLGRRADADDQQVGPTARPVAEADDVTPSPPT